MNTTSVTSTGSTALTDLISRVMDKFDTDKDNKLSKTEFSSFLMGLLDSQTGSTTQSSSSTLATTTTPGPTTSGGMRDGLGTPVHLGAFRDRMPGFAHDKIDNPTMSGADSIKYRAARIFQDYSPMPENIPAIIDKLKAAGVNATQAGSDKIDFGDGYGPIDVIQGAYPGGGVAWQWLPVSQMG